MKNIVCWVDIPAVDLDRAIRFYSDVLGEPVTRQEAGDFVFGLLPHANESVSGCLVASPGEYTPSRNGPLLYLSVEGRLDAAVEAVTKGGGEVLKPKHPIGPYGFRAIVVDSEGNRIALHSQTA